MSRDGECRTSTGESGTCQQANPTSYLVYRANLALDIGAMRDAPNAQDMQDIYEKVGLSRAT